MTVPAPWLRFDFAPGPAAPGTLPLVFAEPVEVLEAWTPAEVLPALRAVQAEADAGRWAAGFVAYEAAPAFDPAMRVPPRGPDATVPLLWFGVFGAPQPAGHTTDAASGPEPEPLTGWTSSTARADYDEGIGRIRAAIARGDTYQVNHTLRLHGRWPATDRPGDLKQYARLRRAQSARYAAYLDLGAYRVVSVSPELFFARDGTRVTTRPMKGTRPRGRWPGEDAAQARALLASEKDRAENVMIVDLLRNDLGRLARPGTLDVPDLLTLERYPTVWQLTSTVTAEVPPETGLAELFGALFPCGSVTGAPKIAAMRQIAALEQEPRQVYCGAVGVLAPGGATTFNVAIRTVEVDSATGSARYGVGGGVTWDSSAADEHAEVLAKAAVLHAEAPPFSLLETLRLDDGTFWLRRRHLDRLRASAGYFGRPDPVDAAAAALDRVAAAHPAGRWRVRLLVDPGGRAATEVYPLAPTAGPVPVLLGAEPVRSADVFLQHKTTHRAAYAPARRLLQQHPGSYDVLLQNERGELTELSTGNVVLDLDGTRCTPPLDCGLLGGVERAQALAEGRLTERVLRPVDLDRAAAVWLLNSVRGWLPVRIGPRAQ